MTGCYPDEGDLAIDDAVTAALMAKVEQWDAANAAAVQKSVAGTIEQLSDQADRLWLLMQAAEGQEKENLLDKWFEIAFKIIDDKKRN